MITGLARRFAVAGFELAWDEWGSSDGPPLVLCHGFSGSAHDFALQIEALAVDRRVVAIDHRGHGLSSNSGVAADYTVGRIADDLVAWLEAEVGGPVDLLGHSMGGMVALRVALGRPDLLRSLVLMDTSAWRLYEPDDPIGQLAVAFFESMGEGSTVLSEVDTPENALIEAATPVDWRLLKDERAAAFDPMAARGIGAELFGERFDEVGDRLGEVTVPVTVIVGEHDAPFVAHASPMAEAVVDGELVVVEGAHHSPQLTHPREWRVAVEAHLARISGREHGPREPLGEH